MSRDNPVFRSLKLIETRILEKLTVENIARDVYFSKYHYQRLFRDTVGESVMEYVTKRRLTLAGRALLETDASVIDIAVAYGYESREGFARSFKAYMGVTPTEYRKYGLTAIQQHTIKERSTMPNTKTTDEIIRELNEFIVKAKEAAALAKKCELQSYAPFWNLIAVKTDNAAEWVKGELARISLIGEQPDKITDMFDIVKVLDDIAYQVNLISFNARLTVARATAEDAAPQKALLQKYGELARESAVKAQKITAFFNELASLIIEDMRKAAAAEVADAIQKGRAAAAGISGYDYIRLEVSNVADVLAATPVKEMTVTLIEDLLFRLNIIHFTAVTDVFRNPEDGHQFAGIEVFIKRLTEVCHVFQRLVTPQNAPAMEMTADKFLSDVGFQGNMYLFYIRGEGEKLGVSVEDVEAKVNEFIRLAHSATDGSAYQDVADKLHKIHGAMLAKGEELQERGGALRFIAEEFQGLAKAVARRIGS